MGRGGLGEMPRALEASRRAAVLPVKGSFDEIVLSRRITLVKRFVAPKGVLVSGSLPASVALSTSPGEPPT